MNAKYIKDNYVKRVTDDRNIKALNSAGAILIEGPKWCGKTWTGTYYTLSQIDLSDPSDNFANKKLAILQPTEILKGELPRLIDEWEEAQGIWDAVREQVGNIGKDGSFVLTGSSTPKERKYFHSGARRIVRVKMFPMTIAESEMTKGIVSLTQLFKGKRQNIIKKGVWSLSRLIEIAIKGGWPANKKHNSIDRSIFKAIARNVATTATYETLYNDAKHSFSKNISLPTFMSYLQVFRNMFLYYEIPAWKPNIRSKIRLRSVSKKMFIDPSIACAMLNPSVDLFLKNLNTFGFIVESMVLRDLLIYAYVLGGELFHYRDNSGLEVDAIIELDNGERGAIEIKLGVDEEKKGIKTLNQFRDKMKTSGNITIKFYMLIVGTGGILHYDDDVLVVPIDLLCL